MRHDPASHAGRRYHDIRRLGRHANDQRKVQKVHIDRGVLPQKLKRRAVFLRDCEVIVVG